MVVRQVVVVAAAAAVAAYRVVVRQAVVASLAPRQPRATLRRPRSHCSCGAPTAATASLPGSERAARARAPRCAPWPAPAAGSCCVTMMRRAALHRTRSEVARTPRSACAPPKRCGGEVLISELYMLILYLCILVRFSTFSCCAVADHICLAACYLRLRPLQPMVSVCTDSETCDSATVATNTSMHGVLSGHWGG